MISSACNDLSSNTNQPAGQKPRYIYQEEYLFYDPSKPRLLMC